MLVQVQADDAFLVYSYIVHGSETKFSTQAHTTNSAAWPVHYAFAVVFSLVFI